jgi:hypothetical protein
MDRQASAVSTHALLTQRTRNHLKGLTMFTVNIFDVANELRLHGFWYCVWRKHSLWSIFIASRMNEYTDRPII